MSRYFRGLWLHPDFLKLWAGQTTSMFGSWIGGFAYSLVAIVTLHASPGAIALLNGCNLVPGLAAGLWVGILADRVRRRSLLIAADLGRAAVLALIPVASMTGHLTMVYMDIAAAIVSVLTMVFDVSYRAYVPSLISKEDLVEGNTKLQATSAISEAGGFSISGLLVQMLGAPLTVAVDAVSFLLSAMSLTAISEPEKAPSIAIKKTASTDVKSEIAGGLVAVWNDHILRALLLTEFAWDLAGNTVGVVIMLFFVHDLRLNAVELGPLCGIGGISALAGALLAPRIARRWGLGPTLSGSLYFNNVGLLACVLAGGPLPLVLLLVGLGQLTDGGRTIYEIHSLSLVQNRAPKILAGRINATFRVVRSAAMLLGLLAGGILGQTVGLRFTLLLALLANLLVPLFLQWSPIGQLRDPHDLPSLYPIQA